MPLLWSVDGHKLPPRRKPTKKKPKPWCVPSFNGAVSLVLRANLPPSALGQDFGSSTSKISLAYQHVEQVENSLGAFPEETFRIARVPLRSPAGLEDPERFNLSSNSSTQQFEFAAFIALNERDGESELIIGRGALLKDIVIPCKTVFVWLAGIHNEEVLFGLPGGPELRACLDDNIFTEDDLPAAIIRHLTLLRDMALQEAKSRNLYIVTIVLSYPNYLCEQRGEPDLERRYYNLDSYRRYYTDCMRTVWEDYPDMVYEFISEGYSASIYVCELFDDENNTLDRARLWSEVSHMMKTRRDDGRESGEDGDERPVEDGDGEEDGPVEENVEDGLPKYVKAFVVDTGASSAVCYGSV